MIRAYVFDAYGTLFDVHSAVSRHAGEIGPTWERLSQTWRAKHLEYTWIYGSIGRKPTFWELAGASLDTAIATVGGGVSPGMRDRLLAAYRTLDAYPEVPGVLAELKRRGMATAILSNGDPDMLADAVASAGIGAHLDHAISVADAGTFKPARAVYDLVEKRLGIPPAAVSFQSSNRWDAAAAKAYGFEVAWINRSKAPAEYADLPPTQVLADLSGLVAA